MLAEYKYIDDEPIEPAKPIASVRFQSDYDITDILTRWGNWARKEAYLQRKNFSLYKSEQEQFKESCSDDDGLLIDSMITALGRMKTQKSQDEYRVLKLYYFGEIRMLDDTVMIVTQSLRGIAKITGINKDNIKSLKESGESCIIGMLAMQTMLTGVELELLQNIRLLK